MIAHSTLLFALPPTPLQDYLCFYCSSRSDESAVGSWKCLVDEDVASPQAGDFCESDRSTDVGRLRRRRAFI